ncbi:MAG TPA: substrate-binding domain-containing protein [Vicinamibacterales bacterium]
MVTRSTPFTLLGVLACEAVVFAALAPNFLTLANLLEVIRLSVEVGLLAVAMTPVLVIGGIDLSVGAMMGLTAVVFGMALHDWSLPVSVAASVALLAGCAGGLLNAVLVSWLGIPALIVTLGSLSLFRGIGEGITRGAINYSGFPDSFLWLGQGYLAGFVPTQLPLFLAIVASYVVLLHRSVIGRAWYAIGLNADGARYAGIPVVRRVALTYMLSGAVAGIAGVVYAAHLGQARADAGTGYELDAITAVVFGGTSVFGGRGTIWGTLGGLFAIALLRNGLHLAALPSELTGVIVGGLLVTTIAFDHVRHRPQAGFADGEEAETTVKNSQVAVLCATVVVAAIIVGGTNVWLVRSLESNVRGSTSATPPGRDHRTVIAVMPKAKGDPYFVSCRAGAEEAARELGVELIWDGPTSLDAAKQNELVENWITRGVDVIAAAVENRAAISAVLRKARARGIRVLTWDADAEPDARDFFVNQATSEGIANALTDEASRILGGSGELAIITGALTAANQNEWIAFIRKRIAAAHPKLTLAAIRPSDDDRDKAFAETQTIMKVYPKARLVMAISAPAVPGAAEAVRQAGRSDISVIGLSLPNINKPYVHAGVVQTVVLWNTRDLGYLTVYSSVLAADRTLAPTTRTFNAGRLGTIEIRDSQIILGPPLLFNKENIDRFDF